MVVYATFYTKIKDWEGEYQNLQLRGNLTNFA
ncbi:hypothetical protein GGD38_005302 [Chitinophagaceae bacterium OAS944]|nr:hypothetical protein [Chitinophagaceae bacterium OAS944]